jgi:raffinose/stachyose/melibiose transport system permease protein
VSIKRKNYYILDVIKWIFLLSIIAFTVYPVIYALLGSFKTNQELVSGGAFLPKKWMFSNYIDAFTKGNFTIYTINSIAVSLFTMILALVTSSLAGYVFARFEFPGKKQIVALYMAFMFISLGAVTLLPLYMLLKSIGLTKSFIAMALVMTGGQAANVFLVMGFIKGIPKEVDEAAYIDGCSYFEVYYSILLPLIRPILAVVALFTFRGAWNDYLVPLVMTIGNPKLRTLTVGVVQLRYSANAAAEWHIMLAGASIAIIPILIVYIIANKQFISGLTAGSVKG